MCVYLYIVLINASAYVPGTISSLRVQRTHIVASFSGSKVNKNLLCCAKGQEMCVCVCLCADSLILLTKEGKRGKWSSPAFAALIKM